jgi:hypothetical protein
VNLENLLHAADGPELGTRFTTQPTAL